jgi:hypothetical protein
MGKVFSFKEIKTDKVPTPQDFELARDIFEGISAAEVERGNFVGSFIFGSVAVGSQGPRSDFDSIVCLTDLTMNVWSPQGQFLSK